MLNRRRQAALHRDRHVAAILGQALEIARHIVARDHVEHQLHALAAGDPRDFLDKSCAL